MINFYSFKSLLMGHDCLRLLHMEFFLNLKNYENFTNIYKTLHSHLLKYPQKLYHQLLLLNLDWKIQLILIMWYKFQYLKFQKMVRIFLNKLFYINEYLLIE